MGTTTVPAGGGTGAGGRYTIDAPAHHLPPRRNWFARTVHPRRTRQENRRTWDILEREHGIPRPTWGERVLHPFRTGSETQQFAAAARRRQSMYTRDVGTVGGGRRHGYGGAHFTDILGRPVVDPEPPPPP